jgi:hypothetical protein
MQTLLSPGKSDLGRVDPTQGRLVIFGKRLPHRM